MSERKPFTLYSRSGAEASAAAIAMVFALAAFAAGIVALYIVKFHKPRVECTKVSKALAHSFGIAGVATAALYVGSIFGPMLFDAFLDSRSRIANNLFIDYAVPFFLEVGLTIFLVNRLTVRGGIPNKWQKLVIPFVAFFIFVIINVIWQYWFFVILFPIEFIFFVSQYALAQIVLPFQLVYQSFVSGDLLFPFKWLWEIILNTEGNQFRLAELFPAIFFIAFLVGIGRITFHIVLDVCSTSSD